MSRTKNRVKSTSCPNCHEVFTDVNHNFCPYCGQENHTHKLPIKHFVMETLESLTHFDTKFLSTIKDLILKPGLVIKNYNNNKRARYVPPIRMYVFITFIFYLLLSILFNNEIEEQDVKVKSTINKSEKVQFGLFSKMLIDSATQKQLQNIKEINYDKVSILLKSKKIKTDWINVRFLTSYIKLQTGELKMSDLNHKIIKYFSYSLFLFMPFFALILNVFYIRRNYFYSEFLVFSIFYHIFLFGISALVLIIEKISKLEFEYLIIMSILSGFNYLGISLKTVFEGTWFKTIFKTFILSFIYSVCLILLFIFMVLGSFIN